MNFLTKFHEDWTINVASRVKHSPPLGSHVFQANITIFELIQDIIKTNLLTIFHEDWTINVASRVLPRVLTRFYYSHIQYVFVKHNLAQTNQPTDQQTGQKQYVPHYYSGGHKNAPPLGSHVFQANITIFKLIQVFNETNLLTKFYEDWTINVASRVLIRQMLTSNK
ncbi:hypothetical protein DPMN_161104 [Dreissena polymorpha]|uniref:Uncharacterized protein n=1 Tax=Dreissena polymorpha TaxID=45954 RepID=A0A9D4ENE8_DREPO|nr:hypothetical protein DPMN_161104 [Dreissena polymorpha]